MNCWPFWKLSGTNIKVIFYCWRFWMSNFLERVSKAQVKLCTLNSYQEKITLPAQTQQKWIEECNIEGGKCIKWYEANQLTPKCTKSTRLRVPKGFRASGLRTQNSGVPGLRTRASGLPRNWSRAPGSAIMLFCFNPKANPRIEKTQQFIFFKRCFYKFFSTLLAFHSYLELFINHNQWMLLEDRFPNLKIAWP